MRGRRLALVLALICGALSGLVYGYGLPKVMNEGLSADLHNASGGGGRTADRPGQIRRLRPFRFAG